ncbi:CHC2 zinc finger domain-containing protein [Sulfuricystis thermophila]|uniref:CHC2 zinc finger domain-containing protein n=1 Tax=Sulfuricystis thermophila TaxID=2496847 RepID=UPI0010366DBD|nr:CHC2 zinc finger domain-containing protein [Sulfuricystis thermophila]NWG31663.1 hypothetical protein [Rhodocyclaceae bacterium]
MRTLVPGRHGLDRFDRARLPDPLTYYAAELERLRPTGNSGRHASARCPFHDDTHPSLTVNLETGAFRCHVPECGAHGRGVLDFHMARYGLGFVAAAKELGAWRTTP